MRGKGNFLRFVFLSDCTFLGISRYFSNSLVNSFNFGMYSPLEVAAIVGEGRIVSIGVFLFLRWIVAKK